MTAVTAPMTCPQWCTVSAEQRAEDLEREGTTCHHAEDRLVATLSKHPSSQTVSLGLSTVQGGENNGQAVVYAGTTELSLEQARGVATALLALVEAYSNG